MALPHAIQRNDYLATLINTLYGIRHSQIILTKSGFAQRTAEGIIQVHIHALIKSQTAYFWTIFLSSLLVEDVQFLTAF